MKVKEYNDKVVSLGCLLCPPNTLATCHHINSGFKRMGDIFTLPLCWDIHHEGYKTESVGNNKKGFIEKYGNEVYLLIEVLRPKLILTYGDIFQKIFDKQDDRIYRGKLKYILIPPCQNDQKPSYI